MSTLAAVFTTDWIIGLIITVLLVAGIVVLCVLISRKKKDAKTEKYNIGMEKTRKGFLTKLKQVLSGYDEITEDLFDDLTDVFIMADIGVETTLEFIDKLKQDIRVKGVHEVTELQAIIVDKMFELYLKNEIVNANLNVQKDKLSVFLISTLTLILSYSLIFLNASSSVTSLPFGESCERTGSPLLVKLRSNSTISAPLAIPVSIDKIELSSVPIQPV